jgi:hypothetical protein
MNKLKKTARHFAERNVFFNTEFALLTSFMVNFAFFETNYLYCG